MTRHLPARPSFEHARKQAKALLKALGDRDPEAAERFRHSHPRLPELDDAAIVEAGLKLADAQLVIAREHGFASWPKLKAHFEDVDLDFHARVNALIEDALEGRLDRARAILDAHPEVAGANIFAAATLGEAEALRDMLARDPGLANARGGPRGWEPLLYLGLSRFLGRDDARTAGLHRAARHLLGAGAEPNVFTVLGGPEFKQTPLFGAAGLANDAELTRLLLAHGADPNDATEFPGSESLYHASEHGDNRCLRLLLAQGPDPEKVSYCLGRKLDFEDPEGVGLYLQHGADPNYRAPFGKEETRLHKAVMNGRSSQIVNMLLAHGADPNLATKDGHTALALAVRLGQAETAELLRQRGGDDARVGEIDRFLGACASADGPAVERALAASPDLVRTLEARDQAVLAVMAFAGRRSAVRVMLEAGFDPNARGEFGTALNMAAWRGHAGVVALLLEQGADPEIENDYGGRALDSAIHGLSHAPEHPGTTAPAIPSHARVIELLLEAGADRSGLPDQTGRPEVDALIARYRD